MEINVASYQALFSRSNTIIVGDFNAKNQLWNSATDNVRGRAIETVVRNFRSGKQRWNRTIVSWTTTHLSVIETNT